jgi:hypothetical protein
MTDNKQIRVMIDATINLEQGISTGILFNNAFSEVYMK